MRQTVLIFSAIAAALLILLNLRKLSVLSVDGDNEFWTTLFAVAFILIGIVLSRYLLRQGQKSAPPGSLSPEDVEKALTNRVSRNVNMKS